MSWKKWTWAAGAMLLCTSVTPLRGLAADERKAGDFRRTLQAQYGLVQVADKEPAQAVSRSAYCAATVTQATKDEWIQNVTVGTINNTTDWAVPGYADYSSLSTDMQIGTGYLITITIGNPYTSDRGRVWIDWNQDIDFDDAGEYIPLTGSPGVGPYTAMITPPPTAVLGSTGMRVRLSYSTPEPTPCGNTSYGEIEDYTVNILPAPEFGACCDGASCTDGITEAACGVAGGVYQGDGSDCEPNMCSGACCDATGACLGNLSEDDCATAGGVWAQAQDCVNGPYVCPQPGDGCGAATTVTDGTPAAQGDNCAATDDGSASCQSNSHLDWWYAYTATCTGTLTMSTEGSLQSDTVLSVLDACGGTEIECDDDSGTGNLSLFSFPTILGSTYVIRVASYNVGCGDYDLNITCEQALQGGCCVAGVCSIEYENVCNANGGSYLGDGSDCTGDPCSMGACCYLDGTCAALSSGDCGTSGGTYSGDATTCTPNTCPQPGDDCGNPVAVDIPADLTYVNNNTTCGRGDDYNATCLGSYDGGEDLLYELNVASRICLDLALVTDGSWSGIAVDDSCGPDASCIAVATSSLASKTLSGVYLEAGTYSVMIDTWPTPTCLNNTTLTITECATGACCSNGLCTIEYAADCVAGGGSYAGDGAACSGDDCNLNGQDDACEILEDPSVDCNANAIPDDCDLAGGTSGDCNANNTPDECESDCNNNGIADECDIANETSEDCQPDGIPDECQLGGGGRAAEYLWDDGSQEDGIGIPAGADVAAMNHFTVVDGAELIESISVAWGAVPAGNAATVYLWSDPNGDGDPSDAVVLSSAAVVINNPDDDTFEVYPIPPVSPGPAGTSFFAGFLHASTGTDQYPAGIDTDLPIADENWIVGDGAFNIDPNDLDNAGYSVPLAKFSDFDLDSDLMVRANGVAAGSDCNNNQIPDECDIAEGSAPDCDANGTIDDCEFLDCDSNGTHDPCDVLEGADDCNGDLIPDKCQTENNDCDGNGIPDDCDLVTDPDCNGNDILDQCDIEGLTSDDCQPDGIPDECQLGGGRAVVVNESFEGAFPPADWTQVIANANFTWKQNTGTPPDGVMFADVEYDPALVPQDEWLLSPQLSMSGTVTVSGSTMGSPYWGVTPFENYDMEVYAVVGAVGGGDDVFVGLLDDEWVTAFVWVPFSYQFTAPASPFRVGFRYVGSDGAQGGIDAIIVDGETGPAANDCNGNGVPDECDNCADLDGDGDADAVDYGMFRATFGRIDTDPAFNECADYDDSGAVGLLDFQTWLFCYRDYVGNPLAAPPVAGNAAGGVLRPGRPVPDGLTPASGQDGSLSQPK